mmetsp:Transcript_10549/g.35813  ORF Transcript_10549/g.35813 Transcript_10549/m.35813 type:complete len:162 (-) Transcript_10549:49-534(-)
MWAAYTAAPAALWALAGWAGPYAPLLAAAMTCTGFLARAVGFVLVCVVYGYYPFEQVLVCRGLRPDAAFSFVERHWAYFMGFGAPSAAVALTSGSYFVAYGVYAVLFPFFLMLGVLSSMGGRGGGGARGVPRLAAFALPRRVARTVQGRLREAAAAAGRDV